MVSTWTFAWQGIGREPPGPDTDCRVYPTVPPVRTHDDARVTLHVLVVDDDRAFCGLMARIIAAFGLGDVVQAGTCADALEAAKRFEPVAALVDVGLPDGDGLELARQLAAAPWAPSVVVTSSDPDASRRAGGLPFIAKHDLADVDLRSFLAGGGE